MLSLWTISAAFLILIGVNVCIYIGKRAYRTHVLLKNTVSYVLLQYGVGVLVVYLLYLELMSLFGIDARPSITRELVLWSLLTVTTASVSYLISQLAVVPSDGLLYHVHKVLMHRIMDGTRPQAWRTTMRQFETELSKTGKYKYDRMLPRFLHGSSSGDINRRRSFGDMRRQSSFGSEKARASSDTSLLNRDSENEVKKVDRYAQFMEASVRIGGAVLTTVTTTLTHWYIRLSGLKITLGDVDEYYKGGKDKRARIPNRRVPTLMMNSANTKKNQLNLDEYNGSNESESSFE